MGKGKDRSLKVYQSGFTQPAFQVIEDLRLDPQGTTEVLKALTTLAENEDVAEWIGETGTKTVLKQLENNMNDPSLVEAGTVKKNFIIL